MLMFYVKFLRWRCVQCGSSNGGFDGNLDGLGNLRYGKGLLDVKNGLSATSDV